MTNPAAMVTNTRFKPTYWAATSTGMPKPTITETKAHSITPRRAGVLGMAEPSMVQGQCNGKLPLRDVSGADDMYGFGSRRSVRFMEGFKPIGMRPEVRMARYVEGLECHRAGRLSGGR